MRNDRDDNYEEPSVSNSEYHYSEEESYDSDPGVAKSAPVSQEGTLQRAAKSKRLIASLVLFLVLVVVVYKMNVQGSSTPSLEITPVSVKKEPANITAQAPSDVPASKAQQAANQQSSSASAPNQDMAQLTQAMSGMASNAAGQPPVGVPPQPAALQTPPAQMAQPPQPTMPGASTVPATQQAMTLPQQAMPPQPSAMPMQQQQVDTGMPQPMQIPEQSPVSVVQGDGTSAANQVIDGASAMMANQANQLEAAAQMRVTQQVEAYQKQNEQLKDQLSTLNSRVALMEQRLTTLVQALSQQYQGGGSAAPMPLTTDPTAQMSAPLPQPVSATVEPQGPPPRVPYNVQAIIPGRAWLRSNTGDTVTVTEGDEIKGVGRVTKIDPYDGVVVIDVRGRSVSLSYGSGG